MGAVLAHLQLKLGMRVTRDTPVYYLGVRDIHPCQNYVVGVLLFHDG